MCKWEEPSTKDSPNICKSTRQESCSFMSNKITKKVWHSIKEHLLLRTAFAWKALSLSASEDLMLANQTTQWSLTRSNLCSLLNTLGNSKTTKLTVLKPMMEKSTMAGKKSFLQPQSKRDSINDSWSCLIATLYSLLSAQRPILSNQQIQSALSVEIWQ